MKRFIALAAILLLIISLCIPLASCNEQAEPTYKELNLPEGNGEDDTQYGDYRAILNARYGEHSRNVFDIFLSDSEEKTPLLIFLYGGGFLTGDKREKYEDDVQFCLNNGVSYAAINYPYIFDTPIHLAIINVMHAIDYIIYHSDYYNIDKDRIAVHGVSSGAGCGLFMAGLSGLSQEQKTKFNIPEIDLVAVGLRSTQSTYDFLKWPELLKMDNFNTLEMIIGQKVGNRKAGDLLYGYPVYTAEDFNKPEVVELRQLLDLTENLTSDSPPIHIRTPVKYGQFEILHSQYYSWEIYNKAEELGIRCDFYYPEDGVDEVKFVDFFFELIGKSERMGPIKN